ncbi:hypothetical protein LEN26_021349 [Aphanomyces euteiches]|nr:hypothetical protein LEN26_021349 [Aphanomyces euteiches]KAH9103242.1 hypothetical protein AeMF1_020380 [Aphanomyces euteiches]KAH9189405.1 hypothetical protein AeNC1_008613 [Aphanomyces euteiches]
MFVEYADNPMPMVASKRDSFSYEPIPFHSTSHLAMMGNMYNDTTTTPLTPPTMWLPAQSTAAMTHDEWDSLDMAICDLLLLETPPTLTIDDCGFVCTSPGCLRRVRNPGMACKTHTSAKKCQLEGCTRPARHSNYCNSHGGGKCCIVEKCVNAAQSQGLCKAHGGGARCTFPRCEKSSQGGGLCRAHGGGKRCTDPGCTKGVQRGNKCATHGGCRTCTVPGCGRNDRGAGLCENHRLERQCTATGCKRLSHAMGMCRPHLRQARNQL